MSAAARREARLKEFGELRALLVEADIEMLYALSAEDDDDAVAAARRILAIGLRFGDLARTAE